MLHNDFLSIPIAHRGLHDKNEGRIENSRAAASAAIARGYGIEIDVQLTSDGAAVVFHDDTVDRLTEGVGPVRNRTRSEFATLKLSGSDETVPSLLEILEIIDGRVPLLVEVKDQDGALGDDVGPLEAAVARDLEGYPGPVAVMSFNPNSISALQSLAPGIPRGLVTDAFDSAHADLPESQLERLRRIEDFDRVGASFVSHNHLHLDMGAIAELKARDVPVLCWTVRSAQEEAIARRIADNVTFEQYLAPLGA